MRIKLGNKLITNIINEKETLSPDNILKERMRYVRDIHNLSVYDVANLSGLCPSGNKLSSGSINRWELGKCVPETKSLYTFCEIFGINIRWLVGASEEPYDKNMLLNIERKILCRDYSETRLLNYEFEVIEKDKQKERKDITIYPHSKGLLVAKQYVDESLRTSLYKPACRANIIFLLNRIKLHFINILEKSPEQSLQQGTELMVNPDYFLRKHLFEVRYFKLCNFNTEQKSLSNESITEIEPIYSLTNVFSLNNILNL